MAIPRVRSDFPWQPPLRIQLSLTHSVITQPPHLLQMPSGCNKKQLCLLQALFMEFSRANRRSPSLKRLKILWQRNLNILWLGKFSQWKPSMDLIRKFIAIQNFKGTVLAGLLDKKHILLRFAVPEDYVRLFSRSIWNVNGKPMRILKWTSNFRTDRESSIIPLWISLPMLPIHLVNQEFIFSLVSSFSKPLRIDNATEQLKRPSVARVQVEFDLLDLLPPRVWVQSENGSGFWQTVEIEDVLPAYCRYCWHIGHLEQCCTVKHPEFCIYSHTQGPTIHKEYRAKQHSMGINLDIDIDHLGVVNGSIEQAAEQQVLVPDELVQGINDEADCVGVPKLMDRMPHISQLDTADCNRHLMLDEESEQMQKAGKDMLPASSGNQVMENLTLDAPQQTKNEEVVVTASPHSLDSHATAQGKSLNAPTMMQITPGPTITNAQQGTTGKEHTIESYKAGQAQMKGSAESTMDRAGQKGHAAALQVQPNTPNGSTMDAESALDLGSKGFISFIADGTPKSENAASHTKKPAAAAVKKVVPQDASTGLVNEVLVYSEGCPISNSFEVLSMPPTKKALKSSGIDSQDSIQAELQYMLLDPKAQLGEYISDKVFEEKFTPAQRITRTRKKKQIFDL